MEIVQEYAFAEGDHLCVFYESILVYFKFKSLHMDETILRLYITSFLS